MSASYSSSTAITSVLSIGVALASLAGLYVAIQNVRKAGLTCNARSLSIAYIVFFVVATLAVFGAAGTLFKGTDVATSAGVTLAAFASMATFVIAVMLLFAAQKIEDASLKKMNVSVFSILVGLSLANTVFLLTQHRNLLTEQPLTQSLNYVRNRFRGDGYTPVSAMTPARA